MLETLPYSINFVVADFVLSCKFLFLFGLLGLHYLFDEKLNLGDNNVLHGIPLLLWCPTGFGDGTNYPFIRIPINILIG
jgi:hypothetical protein